MAPVAALWVVSLAVALYASEKLVHYLTELGHQIHISLGLLGFLVACGADAPEVTSALISMAQGSGDVGLGVVVGSNVYNLAALLGLSAVLARSIPVARERLLFDGGVNLSLTLLLLALLAAPSLHAAIGAALLLVLVVYVIHIGRQTGPGAGGLGTGQDHSKAGEEAVDPVPAHHPGVTLGLVAASVVAIVAGSDVLVQTSVNLGKQLGVPNGVIGTFVLAIATSLPNTWAAISLARRGLSAAVLSTAFNSNSINIAVGVGLPSLVINLHASAGARNLAAPWLLGMSILASALMFTRRELSRPEGTLLLAVYGAFVVLHVVLFD